MSVLLEIALKSIGLLLIVALVVALMRNASAAMRHRVWAVGFVALAALPLLAVRLPEIRIERPVAAVPHTTITSEAAPVSSPKPPLTPLNSSPTFPIPERRSSPSVPEDLVFLWALGAVLLLGRTYYQLLLAKSWARTGEQIPNPPAGYVPPHTLIVRTPSVDVPMTLGFFRPTILLPVASKAWPEERTRAVLLHEGAHIQRNDWAWLIFTRVVGAFFWPNPMVIWAASKMRVEAELSADNAVLLTGFDAPNYAATLVDLAEGLRNRSVATALPFVEPNSLKGRVREILKSSSRRGPVGRLAAIGALLLGVGIVVPYAATRVVPGPETIHDGVVELIDGRFVEIVAITEMRGKVPVSWDIHGALLRRPFPIGQSDLQTLRITNPTPEGAPVRYVIFRVNDPDPKYPLFLSAGDNSPEDHTYMGMSALNVAAFRDALGGSYRLVKMPVPAGAKTANLSFKVPASDWKIYAYKTYQKGEERRSFNPTANIQIAPQMPSQGKGTQASFIIPPEFSDRESSIRFFPSEEGAHFEGMTGPLTATTQQAPNEITRVEVISRPLRAITFADLPLEPDPKATYRPRHFLPREMVTANNSVARLSDGTTLRIDNLSYLGDGPAKVWDANGDPAVGKANQKWLGGRDRMEPIVPGQRPVRLWLVRRPSGFGDPSILFDGEGWPLFHGFGSSGSSQEQLEGFVAGNAWSGPSDIAARVAAGPFHTVAELRPGGKGITWGFEERESWTGVLRVTFPAEITDRLSDSQLQLNALDAEGKPVMRPDGGRASSQSSGWIEFDLPKKLADRVKVIRVISRPYSWVKFPSVALAPKQ